MTKLKVVPEPSDEDVEESTDDNDLWERSEEQSELEEESSSEQATGDDEQDPFDEYDDEDQRETA